MTLDSSTMALTSLPPGPQGVGREAAQGLVKVTAEVKTRNHFKGDLALLERLLDSQDAAAEVAAEALRSGHAAAADSDSSGSSDDGRPARGLSGGDLIDLRRSAWCQGCGGARGCCLPVNCLWLLYQ